MSMLQQIRTGRHPSPPRFVIYGTEGIGKSTTAAQARKPIFIPTEDGLDQIDCASFPLATSLADVETALQSLINERHDFETVVLDSCDWTERLVWDALCQQFGVASIEKVDGGYAKGYTHALTPWRRILDSLNVLRNQRGMCVILLAHAKVEKFEDPEQAAYDRYRSNANRGRSRVPTPPNATSTNSNPKPPRAWVSLPSSKTARTTPANTMIEQRTWTGSSAGPLTSLATACG